jgi:hypothetical protein
MNTSNYRSHATRFAIGFLLLCALFVAAPVAHADSGLSITITPPLIQLSIGPGESWTSALKVVNNNDFDMTYYAQVVDMQANGENGQSKFIPLVDEDQSDPTYQSFALARWVTLSTAPIFIKAGQTGSVPFTVNIPSNAEPGGHYAAILVGTQPGGLNQQGNLMKISSFVSSLLFLEIKGDATESGRIREFSTSQSLYQTPNVDFTVRFENTGNTHVRPEGEVTIYNMWGKQRGQVLFNNQNDDFGNVLPQSIRKFQFSWSGEQSLLDIGPYSAVVSITYGSDGKKSVVATTYFWVVPVVPVATGIGIVLFFIFLITWLIRRYIRRALMLEKARFGAATVAPIPEVRTPVMETLIEPIREGVIDLRSVSGRSGKPSSTPMATAPNNYRYERSLTPYQFFIKYRLFFVFLFVCIAFAVTAWWYFAKVLEANRGYQISNVTIQSEPAPTQ